MKKKITKILGVGLAFMLVASLMVAFAPVAAAADYEENDWGTWGLPDTEPDTDVGPIAIAPDGTLYAALQSTYLATSGDGSASWSSDYSLVGDYSAKLIGGDQDGNSWAAVVIPLYGMVELADVTEFIYNYTFESAGNWGPHICFYTHDPVDGEAADITLYSGGTGPPAGTPADAGLNTVTVVPATPGFFWYGSETTFGGLTQGLPNMYTLNDFQTTADFSGHVIDRIQIEYGWWGTGDANEPAYVDDVSLNGIGIGLEDAPRVVMSEDNGYTWDDTELDAASAAIVDIAISPNYDDDETIYVACYDGTVYRLAEAGDANPIALRGIPGGGPLYSIDVWSDDDDNWIIAGTWDGVFEILDAHGGDWIDYQLTEPGYEVAFAPDFDDIEIIWALTDDGSGDFMLTSTIAPGQWRQVIADAVVTGVGSTMWADMDFPDDYTSDVQDEVPLVFLALTATGAGGGVYMVEGVEAPGDSVATQLMDDEDMISLAVSGDIILAGAMWSPEIYISDDLGASWDDVDKMPTGEGWTYVAMAPGDFDPEDGVAYAATSGAESAFSRSEDGGEVWNQTGIIDTAIDDINDLAFHPDFPDTPTFMMVTVDWSYDTYSLWLTNNGDEDEPDYYRVLCGYDGGAPGNIDAEEIFLVEYAQDGDAIYIFGDYQDTIYSIWKSTDDGQTFGKKRGVAGGGVWINDWVIPDSRTIYAATDGDGFAMSINSGLSWSTTVVSSPMNDIALSPDFEDDETILLGGFSGGVFISDDEGDSWEDTGGVLNGTVFVAFDPDYADEDSDGFELIYAVDDDGNGGNAIQVGEEDEDDTEWDVLEDDTNDEGVTGYFYGLQVSADRALYAIADSAAYAGDDVIIDGDPVTIGDWANVTGVVRLLLDEDDSLWEAASEGDLVDPDGLWLSAGSNVLWTIDIDTGNSNETELWVLEDTLSGQVTLDSPPDGAKLDRLEVVRIAWDELRGADDDYAYELNETSGLGIDIDGTTDDTDVNVSVTGSSEYDWKVRVAPGEPWHSRWSDEWTFNTALGPAPWAPTLYTPGGVWQYSGLNVELMPAFSWESAKNADGYQFVLADNAEFTSPLVNEKTPESAYNLDFELEYNSNYFWRVMAYKGNDAISRWSDIGAFTTIEKAAPAPPAPAPPATVTQPAPAPIVLPTLIPPVLLWVIIGIGAALIITVVVLIVRTRRSV